MISLQEFRGEICGTIEAHAAPTAFRRLQRNTFGGGELEPLANPMAIIGERDVFFSAGPPHDWLLTVPCATSHRRMHQHCPAHAWRCRYLEAQPRPSLVSRRTDSPCSPSGLAGRRSLPPQRFKQFLSVRRNKVVASLLTGNWSKGFARLAQGPDGSDRRRQGILLERLSWTLPFFAATQHFELLAKPLAFVDELLRRRSIKFKHLVMARYSQFRPNVVGQLSGLLSK